MKFSNNAISRQQRGFSLVEILTVVSIIVVLMGMVLGMSGWAQKMMKTKKAETEVKLMEGAIQLYEADTGEYPPGDGSNQSSAQLYIFLYENGINTNTKVYMEDFDPKGSNMFSRRIKNGLILDPFKHKKPYFYLRGVDENGEENAASFNPDFDLWSLGPNGKGRGDGGNSDEELEDDITNWD